MSRLLELDKVGLEVHVDHDAVSGLPLSAALDASENPCCESCGYPMNLWGFRDGKEVFECIDCTYREVEL